MYFICVESGNVMDNCMDAAETSNCLIPPVSCTIDESDTRVELSSRIEETTDWSSSKIKETTDWTSLKIEETTDWTSSKIEETTDWTQLCDNSTKNQDMNFIDHSFQDENYLSNQHEESWS